MLMCCSIEEFAAGNDGFVDAISDENSSLGLVEAVKEMIGDDSPGLNPGVLNNDGCSDMRMHSLPSFSCSPGQRSCVRTTLQNKTHQTRINRTFSGCAEHAKRKYPQTLQSPLWSGKNSCFLTRKHENRANLCWPWVGEIESRIAAIAEGPLSTCCR